jgi:PAS domain S-box-containing protein
MPIPVLIILIGVIYASVDRSLFYEPSWLLPLLNTLFITVTCGVVAVFALLNFHATRRLAVLLLGCGVLAFGTAAVIAGFLREVPVRGANLNVTIYNSGALLGALFHSCSALVLLAGVPGVIAPGRRRYWVFLGVGAAVLPVCALSVAAVMNLLPPFFVQGSGPTLLRQLILGSADVLFIFCFVILMAAFSRNGERFLSWYACALALTSISLSAFFVQTSVGSAIGWTGRFSQYLGGMYFLAAILAARRGARARRTSLFSVLGRALSPAEERFRVLAGNAPDIILRIDRDLRHTYVNPAGLRFYGRSARDVVGRAIDDVGLPEPLGRLWVSRVRTVLDTGEGLEAEDRVPGKDGTRSYHARCVPERGVEGTVESVLVVSRDQTERERAIEGLRASEDRYRTLAEVFPECIVVHRAGEILYINPAGVAILRGGSAEATVGRSIFDIILAENMPLARERVRRVEQEGLTTPPIENEYMRFDGTRFAGEARGAPITYEGRRATLLVIRDISQRKRIEDSLRASEDRFRSLFTGMTEGFALHEIVCDREGVPVDYRFLEINPAFELLTGLKADQVIGRLQSEVLPDNEPSWVCRYGKVALTGEPVHFDAFSGPLGRHYEVFAYRPAPGQFAVVFMDITARRKMEQALQEAHNQLEQRVEERTAALTRTNRLLRLLSECNQALVTLDDEQELDRAICQIMCEQGGYRMAWVGYAEQGERRMVRPVARAGFDDGYLEQIKVSWADDELGRGPTGRAIREGCTRQCADFATESEVAPWRREALRRGYRSSIALPLFADGRPFGALTVYADRPSAFEAGQVTLLQELAGDLAYGIVSLRGRLLREAMRKSLEEKTVQLRSLASEIIQAEETERRRIARVLHDQLQQLIAAARYQLESLKAMWDDPSYLEAVGRVDATMAESLKVSRSLTTELSPPVRHGGQLEPVLEWLAVLMKQKHGLVVDVLSEGERTQKSEEIIILLYQSVRELLFNVAKHAGVDAASVSIREADRGVTIVVEDSGAGFDTLLLERSPRVSGGYGIFSIRERLTLHGGCLSIESAPGKGSKFILWVPLARAVPEGPRGAFAGQPPAPCGEPPGEPAEQERRIRVLLADDHPVVRRGIALALKEYADIEVVGEAQDGRQAVQMVSRLLPDVVIMDMRMPGMAGVEATRAIHEEYPNVRVIGFSALESPEEARAMREAGAVGYHAKSDPPARLVASIRACTDSPSQ